MAPMSDDSPQPATPEIVVAGPEHLDGLVACHRASFSRHGNVIMGLGKGLLRSHCRFYIERADAICVVALDAQGRVTGFVLGGSPDLQRRFVRQHAVHMALAMLLRAPFNASLRRRLWAAVRRVAGRAGRCLGLVRQEASPEPAVTEPEGRWGTLYMIGTRRDARGQGIGEALMRRFDEEAARQGFRTMRLVTKAQNEVAARLYARAGWQKVGSVGDLDTYERKVGGLPSSPSA